MAQTDIQRRRKAIEARIRRWRKAAGKARIQHASATTALDIAKGELEQLEQEAVERADDVQGIPPNEPGRWAQTA